MEDPICDRNLGQPGRNVPALEPQKVVVAVASDPCYSNDLFLHYAPRGWRVFPLAVSCASLPFGFMGWVSASMAKCGTFTEP